MKTKLFFICSVLLVSITIAQTAKLSQGQKQVNLVKNGFYENKGQIVDQNYKANPAVKYLLCSPGFNIQLRLTGFSYDTYTEKKITLSPGNGGLKNSNSRLSAEQRGIRNYHRVDIELIGCNSSPAIIAGNKSDACYNYFTAGTPRGGVSDVHYYQTVMYKDIYPHIDLEFITLSGTVNTKKNGAGVEYNFIVHPGGKVSDIQLRYQGAQDVSLKDNKIEVKVASGVFSENIPESYLKEENKQNQNVRVKYVAIKNNEFGFYLPDNTILTSDLIIDPTPCLNWGTYYGGPNTEWATSIAVDNNNNSYITGETESASNIATAGAYQVVNGGINAYVAKFNSTGSALIWGTYYGGNGIDVGNCIAIGENNNVYIVGNTTSTINIATPGSYQTKGDSANGDVFIAKFNSTGSSLIWGTYYGDTAEDECNGIVLDANDNIYITGVTASKKNMTTAGAYMTTSNGNDAFIAKFDSSGKSLLWGTYYGGFGDAIGQGISLDALNNVYVTGATNCTTGIATPGAYKVTFGGGFYDAFIAKFNPTGASLMFGTYYGGINQDQAYSIKLDASDDIYITGFTQSTSGIATPGAYQTVYGGGSFAGDAFVAKFNSTCTSLLWGTYYGGAADERGYSLALDASEDVYIGGCTESPANIATASAYKTTYGGGSSYGDAFIAEFNPLGTSLTWGTYYGGSNDDCANGITIDGNGNIYAAGLTQSTTGIASAGAYSTTYSGSGQYEMYVASFGCNALTGEKEISEQASEKIYPNPNKGSFTLSSEDDYENKHIEVYNVLGKKVYQSPINASVTKIEMNYQPSGVYLYRVLTENGNLIESGKFVIQQ